MRDLVVVLALGLGGVRSGGVGCLERSPTPAWSTVKADRTSSPGGVMVGSMAFSNGWLKASNIPGSSIPSS
eukprot:2010863-Prorocentrum_lima.AAC.1